MEVTEIPFILDADSVFTEDASIFEIIERPQKALCDYTTKEIGREGERIAVVYFLRKGYSVVELNWRCSFGECDMVLKHPTQPNSIVLVEVKTRLNLSDADPAIPELNVTKAKQEKYKKLALMYMAFHPDIESVRFDVVSITEIAQKKAKLRHLINAFVVDEG